MKTSGCKFTRLQGYKEFNSLKDSFIACESRIAAKVDKEGLEHQILMEESQSKQLSREIDEYKECLSRLKKQISKVKGEIKEIDLQESKF